MITVPCRVNMHTVHGKVLTDYSYDENMRLQKLLDFCRHLRGQPSLVDCMLIIGEILLINILLICNVYLAEDLIIH